MPFGAGLVAGLGVDPIVGHANALWLADLVGRGYDVSASIF